jgi:hypothetical protein
LKGRKGKKGKGKRRKFPDSPFEGIAVKLRVLKAFYKEDQ